MRKVGKQYNSLLVLVVLLIAILPLLFIRGEYKGADGKAEEMIGEIYPDYKPWFKPIFSPPSGEIQSLLFATQAAIGAGIIGYVIGLHKGRSQKDKNHVVASAARQTEKNEHK